MATDSKTEKATPKKRRDERKKGNIFQSNDVVNVVFVFCVFYLLKLFFPFIIETTGNFLKHFIELVETTPTVSEENVGHLCMELLITTAKTVLPFGGVCMVIGIVAHGVQTRFLFTKKNLEPKFSRIDPIQGIKKMFSLKNVVELIKNLLKVAVLLIVLYTLLKDDIVAVTRMMDMSIEKAVAYTFEMVMQMILWVTLVFVAIAFFDYLFQRWDYERQIKMSKQELKEEYKQTEGNPQIKGRIRDIQRQRARSRMMQAVPQADVIIKNPTHFAVAIAYDMDTQNAPIVLAKGQDELALRIISVGEESKVAIIEDKPLARGLYANTELGSEIPGEYYGAVAEILVYVYKLNNKMR